MTKAILSDRTNIWLALAAVSLFLWAASCTAADAAAVAGTVAAVGAAATTMLDVVAPLMTPEQFAEFREGVAGIDGQVETTKSVLNAVVDAFQQFRDGVNAKTAAIGQTLQSQEVAIAERTTSGEVIGYSAGGGAAGTLGSRVLSMLKHGVEPKAARQAKAAQPTDQAT